MPTKDLVFARIARTILWVIDVTSANLDFTVILLFLLQQTVHVQVCYFMKTFKTINYTFYYLT